MSRCQLGFLLLLLQEDKYYATAPNQIKSIKFKLVLTAHRHIPIFSGIRLQESSGKSNLFGEKPYCRVTVFLPRKHLLPS